MIALRPLLNSEFHKSAPAANPVFYRSYSRRKNDGTRETFAEVSKRVVQGLRELGKLTDAECELIEETLADKHTLPSGRWLWVGGTEWSKEPKNFSGSYNCTSTELVDWEAFGLMMDLAMMGSGTGAIIETRFINSLPTIRNRLEIVEITEVGTSTPQDRQENTSVTTNGNAITIKVGDSRRGWVDAYQATIETASDRELDWQQPVQLRVDLSSVRPAGEKLKGFGGTSNPIKLQELFTKVAGILNGAIGRKLTAVECSLLIDEAACVVVAGNIRRSAGMRQFTSDDIEAAQAKDNLWQQAEDGSWRIDPKRDALRMANHTRVFHSKPSRDEVLSAVTKQFYSGEGAIQFAPEAIARSNADLLDTEEKKKSFLDLYCQEGREVAASYLNVINDVDNLPMDLVELRHRLNRYGLNPCLTGDTSILTVHQGTKTFEELVAAGEDVLVWCVDTETNEASVQMMRNPRITGYNQPILEIEFDSGLKVKATHNHNFFTLQRNKKQAKDLQVGDSVAAFAIHQHRDGHLRIVRNNKVNDSVRQQFCHRVIAEYYGIEGEVIHHIDGDPTNNLSDNLEGTSHKIHNQMHYASRCRKGFYHKTPGPAAAEHIANHKVVAIRDAGVATVYNGTVDEHHNYVVVDPEPVGKSYISGILSANCGEILGTDFHCNLSEIHLNRLDPGNYDEQERAFKAGALVAASLLHHQFEVPRYRESREMDPIVGVSFTGLFDFFVHAFGAEWLRWFVAGRPNTDEGKAFKATEAAYLKRWRIIVDKTIREYCEKHDLKVPNRSTTVQPAGTKSLLTGASSGWHPPKSQRFIRRITFRKDDPIALACMDYGYNVVPSQSDKDEDGRLLDNPFDPRCTEWLVEIPTEVSWANIEGCDAVDISAISAAAQFDFYMQVQRHYTAHNTSATIEYRENEIKELSDLIYNTIQKDGGYISAALLARFDANATFPRLPFEPIAKEEYLELQAEVSRRQKNADFFDALKIHDDGELIEEGPAACDSDKCLIAGADGVAKPFSEESMFAPISDT